MFLDAGWSYHSLNRVSFKPPALLFYHTWKTLAIAFFSHLQTFEDKSGANPHFAPTKTRFVWWFRDEGSCSPLLCLELYLGSIIWTILLILVLELFSFLEAAGLFLPYIPRAFELSFSHQRLYPGKLKKPKLGKLQASRQRFFQALHSNMPCVSHFFSTQAQ